MVGDGVILAEGGIIEPTTTLTDDPEGFATFYRMVFRRDIPLRAFRWVRLLYEAHAQGKGFVIEAFRGSSRAGQYYLPPRTGNPEPKVPSLIWGVSSHASHPITLDWKRMHQPYCGRVGGINKAIQFEGMVSDWNRKSGWLEKNQFYCGRD